MPKKEETNILTEAMADALKAYKDAGDEASVGLLASSFTVFGVLAKTVDAHLDALRAEVAALQASIAELRDDADAPVDELAVGLKSTLDDSLELLRLTFQKVGWMNKAGFMDGAPQDVLELWKRVSEAAAEHTAVYEDIYVLKGDENGPA